METTSSTRLKSTAFRRLVRGCCQSAFPRDKPLARSENRWKQTRWSSLKLLINHRQQSWVSDSLWAFRWEKMDVSMQVWVKRLKSIKRQCPRALSRYWVTDRIKAVLHRPPTRRRVCFLLRSYQHWRRATIRVPQLLRRALKCNCTGNYKTNIIQRSL